MVGCETAEGFGVLGSVFSYVWSLSLSLSQRLVAYHVAVFIEMLIALCELPNANPVE